MTDETRHHQESTEGTAPPRRPVLGLRVAQRRRALPGSGGRRLADPHPPRGRTEGPPPPPRPVRAWGGPQPRRAPPGGGGRGRAGPVAPRHEPAVGPSATRLATARILRRPTPAAAARPAPARAA